MTGHKALRLLIIGALAGTPLAAASSERAAGNALATAVTAGVDHTCALTRAGGVKCWGYNGHDELGTGKGDNQNSSTPVDVSGLRRGVSAISAGLRHSCALTSAGGVKCWGAAYSGALGDGTTERRLAPVDVSGLSSGVTAISGGYDYSCALTGAGGVKCWGSNMFGVLGDGTTDDRWTPVGVSGLSSGVSAIATGSLINCALMSTGGLKCWGFHYGPTPADVPGLSGVTAITAGGPLCALMSGGGVKCWGSDYGWTPVDVPGLGSGVRAIVANGGHSCALTSGGGVKCWGENDHGQLGDGTRTKRPTPVSVSGLQAGVTAIAAGAFHTCVVTRTGGIKCWGVNGSGELGDGTTHTRLRPVGVVGFGPRATLAVLSRSVAVTRARIAPVKLICGHSAACKGTLTLVGLGRRSFSIAAGYAQTVRVKLTGRGFRRLVRAGTLSAKARIRYKQPAGGASIVMRTITLHAPK